MHKIFGTKENAEYTDREGAYLIPFHGNLVGVIHTSKGYFLLGGGVENGESHSACIERECMEEAGYRSLVKGKVCSAEAFTTHPTIKYFHPIQTYYYGELLEKVAEPIEEDHELCWVEYDRLKGNMFVEMQNWALEQVIVKRRNNMDKNTARNLLVRVLDDMEQKALEMKVQGVGVACFLDEKSEVDWIGEMKVVQTPYNLKEGWNLVAIAWSKAGEVIASLANSGNPDRKKIMGELGFVGGAYEEGDGYKLAFAFSGATSEEDLEIAEYGISKFKEYAK